MKNEKRIIFIVLIATAIGLIPQNTSARDTIPNNESAVNQENNESLLIPFLLITGGILYIIKSRLSRSYDEQSYKIRAEKMDEEYKNNLQKLKDEHEANMRKIDEERAKHLANQTVTENKK